MKKGKILVGLFSMVIMASTAFGSWWRPTFEERSEHIAEKVADKLDLNDNQKSKLEKIRQEIVENRKKNKLKREELKLKMIAEVESDVFNRSVFDEQINSDEGMLKTNLTFFLDKLEEFHQVLEPKQRTELAEILRHFSRRMRHH